MLHHEPVRRFHRVLAPEQRAADDTRVQRLRCDREGRAGHCRVVDRRLRVSATDVSVPTYRGSLTFGRTFTTLAPGDVTASPAAGVLGPGWQAALYGPSAGQAGATFVDNSANGYVTLIEPDRTPETFNFSSGTTYTGLADTAAKGWTITQNSPTQYTLTEPNGTQTVYTQTTTNTGALVWVTSQVTEASGTPSAATTTYSYDTSGRVTQILAPIPAGISCTPTLGAGCRAMLFNYASTTTAVTGTPGDYANQLRSVDFLAYDPVAADPNCVTETTNMCTVEVAHYAYDITGHLVNAWDPRITPNLKATYTYDSTSGRLVTLTPAGLATTTFGYDSLGRISTVSHPDPSGPTATSTIVYGDKLPFDSTGPIDLSPTRGGGVGRRTVQRSAKHDIGGDRRRRVRTRSCARRHPDQCGLAVRVIDLHGRERPASQYGDVRQRRVASRRQPVRRVRQRHLVDHTWQPGPSHHPRRRRHRSRRRCHAERRRPCSRSRYCQQLRS